MNRLSARIAARSFAAQVEALGRADDAGDRVESVVRRAWSLVLAAVRTYDRTRDPFALRAALADALTPLHGTLAATIGDTATKAAEITYDQAADAVADLLPRPTINATVRESRQARPARLTEREIPPARLPGFFDLPTFTDLGQPFTLAGADALSDEAARDLFRQLVFPPPDPQVVRAVVFQSDWANRLATQTRLANPDSIAARVVSNLATGGKIRDLARDLLPVVDGVRHVARRIARDETMHATHAMQGAAWAQLGEMVIGYQVNAVLDDRTRPEHRARNGQAFYKRPTGTQRGMDECPQPPRESPKAGGKWAYNCRCFLTPVLRVEDKSGRNLTPPAPIDPAIAADWFANTSERNRRAAVGADRYRAVSRRLRRAPEWGDFTDDAGQLLPLASLTA